MGGVAVGMAMYQLWRCDNCAAMELQYVIDVVVAISRSSSVSEAKTEVNHEMVWMVGVLSIEVTGI